MNKSELEAEFMQLIMGLQSSAWMLLGKAIHPITGKIEKNIEAAKATIDTLIMLKEKTKGNLSKTEDLFLSNTIQQLEINYVEEVKNSDKSETAENLEDKQDVKTNIKEDEDMAL